jgi:RimJ/RimL family protein N-acetyltransferase
VRGLTVLTTDRLLLRPWRDADRDAFAAMSADPQVMKFFPAELTTREASDAFVDRASKGMAERGGWGWFAIEERRSGAFAGVAGLAPVRFEAHFTPAVEIGWRLARAAWGQGFATEAARASLAFAFDELGLDEVVALAVPANERSLAVMRRVGMTHDPADDFDLPDLPAGDPLRRHVLYRLTHEQWASRPSLT